MQVLGVDDEGSLLLDGRIRFCGGRTAMFGKRDPIHHRLEAMFQDFGCVRIETTACLFYSYTNVLDLEESFGSGCNAPRGCSGRRRPLIAGCLSVQQLGVDYLSLCRAVVT